MLGYLAILAACAAVLLFASRLVFRQLLSIARELSVPPFLVALFLVAISTSIPELFIGITSASQGVPAFSLGDILGANIIDITFVAGLVILLSRKRVRMLDHIERPRLYFTFFIACLPTLLIADGILSRDDGLLLMALYVFYIILAVSDRRAKRLHLTNTARNGGVWKHAGLFACGVALLLIASQCIIYAGRGLSTELSVAPFVIGVFALALSTTLPELAFGIRAALARKPELSLADLIGSSAVNSGGILGLVALIHPIAPQQPHSAVAIGLLGVLAYAAFAVLFGRKTDAPAAYGAILLALYLLFMSFNFLLAA